MGGGKSVCLHLLVLVRLRSHLLLFLLPALRLLVFVRVCLHFNDLLTFARVCCRARLLPPSTCPLIFPCAPSNGKSKLLTL